MAQTGRQLILYNDRVSQVVSLCVVAVSPLSHEVKEELFKSGTFYIKVYFVRLLPVIDG